MRPSLIAAWLAFLVPTGLIAGALTSEHVFGLYPCEMCLWQRWPHYSAIIPGLLGLVVYNRPSTAKALTLLAALGIFISGLIGGFHAGVEYGWWEGITTCAATAETGLSTEETLENILSAPLIRCDVAPWELFGISLAGYNFLLSVGSAVAIFGMTLFDKNKR